jgi:hypothetical protein
MCNLQRIVIINHLYNDDAVMQIDTDISCETVRVKQITMYRGKGIQGNPSKETNKLVNGLTFLLRDLFLVAPSS